MKHERLVHRATMVAESWRSKQQLALDLDARAS
jgi:hypothetical protein